MKNECNNKSTSNDLLCKGKFQLKRQFKAFAEQQGFKSLPQVEQSRLRAFWANGHASACNDIFDTVSALSEIVNVKGFYKHLPE